MTEKNVVEEPQRTRRLATSLFIAFAIVSIFIVLVTQSLQYFFNQQYQKNVLSSRLLLIAQEASKTVSSFIEEQFRVLETAVGLSNPISLSTQEREDVLASLLGLQPAYRQLVLLDGQNRQLAEASRLALSSSGKIFAQLPDNVLAQVHQGQRYISSVYIDDATSEPLVVIALPIKDIFGDFQGTLAVEVNLKFMWDLVDQLEVGETGYAYVVDSQGNLLAFNDTSRVLQSENVMYIDEVGEFVENPNVTGDITPEIVAYDGLLNTKVVGTYVPLGTPQWAVVIELPIQEAYQESRAQGSLTIISSLGVTILAGLIGVFVARMLAVPIANLTDVATRISIGNLSLDASVNGPYEVTQLASAFNSMTSQLRGLVGSLEQRIDERTRDLEISSTQIQKRASQLEAIAEVTGSIASLQGLDQLLPFITQIVSERFDFYHTGIFLLSDDKQYAVLKAANSEGGQKMLVRKHQLRIGQEGIVGFAVSQKRARIALDVGDDAVYFDNPDLPTTRSEIALPLLLGNEVFGALDVQSEQSNAFSNEDIDVLTILANQVSVAIQNARLFEQSQKAMYELENTFQRYVRSEWQQFTEETEVIGYRARQSGLEAITYLSPANDSKGFYKLPLVLRGVTFGNLNIKMDETTGEFNQEEISLIQTIGERLAVAMESARLLEDSQRTTAKELVVGEIATKIGASINMRNVLQTAVEELGRAIPGSEIIIQLEGKDESGGSY